jgi:protein ImuA
MHNVARQQQLAELRARIAGIDKRPLLTAPPGAGDRSESSSAEWQALREAPAGLLHEVYADEQRQAGIALGFAFGMARQLITPARPALLLLQLRHEAQDTGLPYGPGFEGFGIATGQLVMGRMASLTELLWAAEEAIACRAIAGVVAEVLGAPKALDFTVSRRLSLRAASGGASVFLLRYGVERQATAAKLRWRVAPAMSQPPPFDARAPGPPRWRITLEKGRLGGTTAEAGGEVLVDWTEHGFAPADSSTGGRDVPRPAALGAAPAALGDRLSQAS